MAIAFACLSQAWAQQERTNTLVVSERLGWEYEVRVGVNIGGATPPIPFPEEIRSVESYNPRFNASIEGVVTKWLTRNPRWGFSTGLRIEAKGMKTAADVKNYSTAIIDGDSEVAGYYTGRVDTKYSSTFFTLPLTVNYRFNPRWKVRAGLYGSVRVDSDFSGYVSDGYLRDGTPTGEKIVFENGKHGTYDFSSSLRRFQYGVQLGGSWAAFKHLSVHADLTVGLNKLFQKDFKTISFGMRPIYLNIGFGYKF